MTGDLTAPSPSCDIVSSPCGPEVDSLALAGAAAIERIILERDSLRRRVDAQQHELSVLREKIEGQVKRIRADYVRLATGFLSGLNQLDGTIREAIEEASGKGCGNDLQTLISLAQRLSPSPCAKARPNERL